MMAEEFIGLVLILLMIIVTLMNIFEKLWP